MVHRFLCSLCCCCYSLIRSRQLLYYPFTPFFVLLGHVIQDPGGPRMQEDLNLLRELVSYFGRMAVEMKLVREMADKLRRTAELFYQLAVRYTQSSATAAGPGLSLRPPADASGAALAGIIESDNPALEFPVPTQIDQEQGFDFLIPNDQEVELSLIHI